MGFLIFGTIRKWLDEPGTFKRALKRGCLLYIILNIVFIGGAVIASALGLL